MIAMDSIKKDVADCHTILLMYIYILYCILYELYMCTKKIIIDYCTVLVIVMILIMIGDDFPMVLQATVSFRNGSGTQR